MDADGDTDADADTDTDTETGFTIALPTPPEPVCLRSWVCPAGWRAVPHDYLLDESGNRFSWCEPPQLPRLKSGGYVTSLAEDELEGDRPVCDPAVDGAFPVLGSPECQPIGDPCPAGVWPEIPDDVTGHRIHVRAGSPAGGDGTRDAPIATIGEAIAAAAGGEVIAIAAGTYSENLLVPRGVTLWGACVAGTVIEARGPADAGDAPAISVDVDATVFLRNLCLTGDQVGLRVGAPGADVSAQGVWIHDALETGVQLRGGRIDLAGVLIDTTRAVDGRVGGQGIHATSGVLKASSCLIEANRGQGILVSGVDASTSLEDVAVRHTLGREGDTPAGYGLFAEAGADVAVTRGLFVGNREFGIHAKGQEGLLSLTDVVVRDTLPSVDGGEFGPGLEVGVGARAVATRLLVERNREFGINVWNEGALTLDDVVVRETRGRASDAQFGMGLMVSSHSRLTLRRGLLEKNRVAGISAHHQRTEVTVEDLVVRDTLSQASDGHFGMGLSISQEARLILLRGLLEQNRSVAVSVNEDGTEVSLQDLTIRDTVGRENGAKGGMGLQVIHGARVSAERARLEGNRTFGFSAYHSGTSLTLTDVTVTDTLADESNAEQGWGLAAAIGAEVSVVRGRFTRNRETGIAAFFGGTHLTLEDVVIEDTIERECSLLPVEDPRYCGEAGGGLALGSYFEAEVALRRVRAAGSAVIGVQIARFGRLEGQRLEIHGNPIGVNLQELPVGYDFFEAIDDLVMEDNQINFDSTALSIPTTPTTEED